MKNNIESYLIIIIIIKCFLLQLVFNYYIS
jgi:hypothetical protein